MQRKLRAERLAKPTGPTAQDLYALLDSKWLLPEDTDTKDILIDTLISQPCLDILARHDDKSAEAAGLILLVLGSTAAADICPRVRLRKSPETVVATLLEAIDQSLDRCEAYFPLSDTPSTNACTIAHSIVVHLFISDVELFQEPSNMMKMVSISYKVWTWADLLYDSERWQHLEWAFVGHVGVVTLHALCAEKSARKLFFQFCEEESGWRWQVVAAWAEGRSFLLRQADSASLEDVGGLIRLMAIFSESSQLAARSIFDTEAIYNCVHLLKKFESVSYEAVSVAADLMHAITYSMERPTDKRYMKSTRRLVRAGIMRPLRQVLLYGARKCDKEPYVKSWDYLLFFLNCMLDHKTTPYIAKSILTMPEVDEDLAAGAALDLWETVMETMNITTRGYLMFEAKKTMDLCDNMACGARGFTPKICAGCLSAFYCSKRCQMSSWTEHHKADCELTTTGVLQRSRTWPKSRMYLLCILACLMLDAETDLPEMATPLPGSPFFPMFNLGSQFAARRVHTLRSLHTFLKDKTVSSTFTELLNTSVTRKRLRLGAVILADPDGSRFYLFGLFEATQTDEGKSYHPVKGAEVVGLDAFAGV
ncbi:hypothetical protein EST38_g7289 [Candolleomyces aberdarensis]|uniref:MYND-type domain-containing protein n=1 Tax=Candolleomyces aberdarensis TaxID=2316362 RepID=A0A4Q2DFL4_9AGAR|nr:hypothetical protein EST38_g7289 [Candolleomyces aberdarensis]